LWARDRKSDTGKSCDLRSDRGGPGWDRTEAWLAAERRIIDLNVWTPPAQRERFKALILISAWCGLRWGEVTELQRKDFSADCALIAVERGVVHRDGKCFVDTPKSKKGRKVVTPPHIRPAIKHHLATYVAKGADSLVFPADRGCHLSDKTFRRYFAAALKDIGRDGKKKPRPAIHDLRHFAGTQTARVGNLVETMGRLGHSTVKASLIYQGIVSGRDAEIAQALSALVQDGDTAAKGGDEREGRSRYLLAAPRFVDLLQPVELDDQQRVLLGG
jgi:integrase